MDGFLLVLFFFLNNTLHMFYMRIHYQTLNIPLAVNVTVSFLDYFVDDMCKRNETHWLQNDMATSHCRSYISKHFFKWIMWNVNSFSSLSVIQYSCGLWMTLYRYNSKLRFIMMFFSFFFFSMNRCWFVTKGFNFIKVWVGGTAGSLQ